MQDSTCVAPDECPCKFNGAYYNPDAEVTSGCKKWWALLLVLNC